MNSEKISIRDLDCIYLTYDEPEKDKFWLHIKSNIPWAKRVDGIKGSDSAHKAAAAKSNTNRFILIDGDNIPDFNFFDKELEINDSNKFAQFRWRSKNIINDIYYGNGGISCWTKSFVETMQTHENTDGADKNNIEFCFDSWYWPMHDCYSVTYPNQSSKQAWRAGFREGVKLCTRSGVPTKNKQEFLKWVWPTNLSYLHIWYTIGRDIQNGFWAILGARTGTHYLMLNNNWDYTEVRDFDKLDKLWEKHCYDDEQVARKIAKELNSELGLNIVELEPEQSKFFKTYSTKKWINTGIMTREKKDV